MSRDVINVTNESAVAVVTKSRTEETEKLPRLGEAVFSPRSVSVMILDFAYVRFEIKKISKKIFDKSDSGNSNQSNFDFFEISNFIKNSTTW